MKLLKCPVCGNFLPLKQRSDPTMRCRACGHSVEQSAPEPPAVEVEASFSLLFENNFESEQGVFGQAHGPRLVSGRAGTGVLIEGSDTLAYPTGSHLKPDQGSLTFWMQPRWPGDDGRDYVFFDVGDGFYNRLRIQKDGANNLRFIVWGPQNEHGAACRVNDWWPNEWHHVGVTWAGERLELYLDGKLRATTEDVTLPARLASQFYIGSSSRGDRQANAVIDDVVIYPRPLGPEVWQAPERPLGPPLPDHYTIPTLLICYYPLRKGRIDRSVTGDVGAPLDVIRRHVQATTRRVVQALQQGSTYHGYKDPTAKPSLDYEIIDTIEVLEPLPTYDKAGHRVPMTDYNAIMNRAGIEEWVEERGIKEVWLWGYHGGVIDIWESNMAGPYGDISNSDRDLQDLPVLSKTYTVYHYNYGRGPSEAVEDHMHQIEAVLNYVDHDLFWNKFVGRPGEGRCGWSHYPPNAVTDYDWANPDYVWSDIEDWRPDGSGQKKKINCTHWNADSLTWFIYWMQNLPGANNGLFYQGRPLTNWWSFIGDFDLAMGHNYGLVR